MNKMKYFLSVMLMALLCFGSIDATAQRTIRRGERQQQTQTQQTRQTQTQTRQTQRSSQSTQNSAEQKYQKDLEKGELLIDEEKYEEAKKHFTKMLAKYPKHEEDINRWLAVCDTFMADAEQEELERQENLRREEEAQQQEEQRREEELRRQELARQQEIENAYRGDLQTGNDLEASGQYEPALEHYWNMLASYSEYPDYCTEINAQILACEDAKKFVNKTITVNGVSFKMVAVKGGTFTMGATPEQIGEANDNEYPAHEVTLSDYYIGETEVTNELWHVVMKGKPYTKKDADKPKIKISWNDCRKFISKLNALTGENFRMPTEAEWEYAARGGNNSQGYKYSGSNVIDLVAWYWDNARYDTHPVRQKQANELGLYDMSGNVFEWCLDWYGSYSSGLQINPSGPSTGSYHVLRSGTCFGNAELSRVSTRLAAGHDDSRDCGLRLCLSLAENVPVEYYDLNGVRVENPSNGLYIRRQGDKVEKIEIK